MWRIGSRMLLVVLACSSVALAHGDHQHTDPGFPFAAVFSGLAFIFALASFWVSWSTRNLVLSKDNGTEEQRDR